MKYNKKLWGGLAHGKASEPLEVYMGNFYFSMVEQSFGGYQDPLSSSQFSLNMKPYLCKVHPSE